ncbi:hypothetical protein GOP47_0019889 [Adiantum capillus-veneris]|uniref:Uncharacterized protein n=1 Tax=Adiantum capillus-veneris TaxID=13818 RepID=A0A9D4UBX5_ADICA|nr:hypothetical protein GOP47_0019889 [Adiantum capillus-veneris]
MGFNIRGGDKSSLALLSSKRGRAYARTRADEAFALPNFSDAIPVSTIELQQRPANNTARSEPPVEHEAENVKQTMLQHESVFKEQLHELHRLYQKQCMLMAESNKDPSCDRVPEPPSSNGSFLCNPETLRLHEERSFGNASSTKGFENNQSYRALLGRMDDVKRFEDSGSSGKPSSHLLTEVYTSSQNQGRHQMFDLEKPPPYRPILDLERPADEYMDVEVHEEKPQIAGLINKSENVFGPGDTHFSGSTKEGESRELVSGISRGSWDNKLLGFRIINNTVSDCPAGSREEMPTGCFPYRESVFNHPTFNEVVPFPPGPIAAPKQSLSDSKKALFASQFSGGLPDLNGDIQFTEQQSSPMQAFLPKHEKDGQSVDVEVDSRACSSTPQLPHWLRQAPSARAFPLHVSGQSSVSQPKTPAFIPQFHDKTTKTAFLVPQVRGKTNWNSNIPVDMAKASSFYIEEPHCPWPQSSTINIKQGEAFHREFPSASSLQFSQVAHTGTAEGPYSGVYGRDYRSGDPPFYFPQARDSEKMGILPTTSASLFPHVVGSRVLGFETHGHSSEPLSRVRCEEPTNFSAVSSWYEQRESFSSLLQQASNPEPVCNRASLVTSASPWEINSSFQGPFLGMDRLERGIFGPHANVRNIEASSSQTKSTTASPAFDCMHAGSLLGWITESMKESESTSCKKVETPFHNGHALNVASSGDHRSDSNPRKILFDLNMSSDDCMPEGSFDACNKIVSSCNAEQRSLKQESEMSRSSGWDAIKAPLMYESQKLQATCFGDSVAAKGLASESPLDTNTTHLRNDTFYLSEAADNLYSEGDMLRNDNCVDYCSGEDETGGGFVGVKSSDGSGLTSCESRDRVHLEVKKARDDSNTSSGEACHSLESRIPNRKEDVAFSSNYQRKRSLGLPSQVNVVAQLFTFPNMQTMPSHLDTKRECSPYSCTEFADESEAAYVVAKKDAVEASKAAELLLSLGLDLPSTVENDDATDNCRKCLDWLADIIPDEDYRQPEDDNVEIAFTGNNEAMQGEGFSLEAVSLDAFESTVLALEPVDPTSECLVIQPLYRGNTVENIPTLRRRPSRRGRAGKDFQKEMLRSMSGLSRHEITEDLQIIEGLIKSAAETTNSCSPSPDDKPLSNPEEFSSKSSGKEKGTKSYKGGRLNGMLSVSSWGESTRRKRMGRQRSQWLSLPPGVRTSLFPDIAVNVASQHNFHQ